MECARYFPEGLEHVVDTCEVCASVAHHWTEMSVMFGCLKHRCGPSPSLLAEFGPVSVLVSESEIAVMKALFRGCSCNLGTNADHPTCNCKKISSSSASSSVRNTDP